MEKVDSIHGWLLNSWVFEREARKCQQELFMQIADSQSSEEIQLFRYSRCDLVQLARSWSERVARVKTDTWAKKGGHEFKLKCR